MRANGAHRAAWIMIAAHCREDTSEAKETTRQGSVQSCPTPTVNLLVVWLVRVTVTHNRAGRHCWPRHIMVGPLLPNSVSSLLSSLQQALNSSNQFFVFVSFLPPLFFLFSIIELCSIDLFCRSTNPLIPNPRLRLFLIKQFLVYLLASTSLLFQRNEFRSSIRSSSINFQYQITGN
ncbi:hypothetical protein F5883DRAFT_84776 [Diaporthe sp. PMI_573]|nr:hypothetical protein F5883DRAFT_84776 [Diaporthaceae sp. PMI_573]